MPKTTPLLMGVFGWFSEGFYGGEVNLEFLELPVPRDLVKERDLPDLADF